MFWWVNTIGGTLLLLIVLLDVYLTVLYARSGAGIFTPRLCTLTWKVFCLTSKPFGEAGKRFLSFCGPTLLVLIGTCWVGGLLLGFGLIVWPRLGTEMISNQGDTPRDFWTAVYVSGYYLTTVGNGDMRPLSGDLKVLMVADSVFGISVITLMLTYFMQIYSALQRRTTFALKLHKGTRGTGDAVEIIAGIGADGNFEGARGELTVIADELLQVYESYHFYETLIFFRFHEALYSLPRAALVVLDLASLLRTAIDQEQYKYLVDSMPAEQLWQGGTHSLVELSRMFLPPRGDMTARDEPTAVEKERWQLRYASAVARLRAAKIKTPADEKAGAQAYFELRSHWNSRIAGFSNYLRYTAEETDPAGFAVLPHQDQLNPETP